jgi:Tellurite resistance protein TerB.
MTHPPSGDIFGDRRRALEDSFFRERDQFLLEKLRLELEAVEEHRHLAHVSGIMDDKVLMNLVKAGVRAETLAAVSLIPLVEVAWADGSVTSDEREAVLKAAAENGIKEGSASHEMLSHWLKDRPDVRIVASWKEYARALAKAMPADAMLVVRERIIGRCRKVAEASGWLLGITGNVSKVEQSAIDEFERAMQP